MTAPAVTDPSTPTVKGRPFPVIALLSLAVGYFALGTASLAVVGLGTSIGSGLGVPAARIGLLVTVFAVVFGVVAPLVPAVLGRMNRKHELLLGLALLTAGEALAAI